MYAYLSNQLTRFTTDRHTNACVSGDEKWKFFKKSLHTYQMNDPLMILSMIPFTSIHFHLFWIMLTLHRLSKRDFEVLMIPISRLAFTRSFLNFLKNPLDKNCDFHGNITFNPTLQISECLNARNCLLALWGKSQGVVYKTENLTNAFDHLSQELTIFKVNVCWLF